MEEKVCRLCFKHKINAIGIYTAAGSKLKIDRVIEQHFGTGEVNKPQFGHGPFISHMNSIDFSWCRFGQMIFSRNGCALYVGAK